MLHGASPDEAASTRGPILFRIISALRFLYSHYFRILNKQKKLLLFLPHEPLHLVRNVDEPEDHVERGPQGSGIPGFYLHDQRLRPFQAAAGCGTGIDLVGKFRGDSLKDPIGMPGPEPENCGMLRHGVPHGK